MIDRIGRDGRGAGFLVLLAAALAISQFLVACGDRAGERVSPDAMPAVDMTVLTDIELSPGAAAGETVFAGNCAVCHGVGAAGSYTGPSLINRVYHPNHHSDASIRVAAFAGVRQHHWTFGDMPPVAGISEEEVEQVICYVREIQYANGVFTDASLLPDCQDPANL